METDAGRIKIIGRSIGQEFALALFSLARLPEKEIEND